MPSPRSQAIAVTTRVPTRKPVPVTQQASASGPNDMSRLSLSSDDSFGSDPDLEEMPVESSPKEAKATTPEAKDEHSPAADKRSPSLGVEKTEETSETESLLEESGPLYILQPRTYTPLPLEPLPSPLARNPPNLEPPREKSPEPVAPEPTPEPARTKQRTSLRQRVSLKTTPPESIQIPPPNVEKFMRPAVYTSPKTYNAPDSAYGSDVDHRHRPGSATGEVSSPTLRPGLMPSPRSDHQFYRPVQASPHSPLQQRPHTAGTTHVPPYSPGGTYQPHHQRNVPSRMGGASMLSNVTTVTYDTSTIGGDRKLKKKRSAFGWLKKAFSLDEEEKAAFETRRHQQTENLYYDSRSPKYLDGRRVS
jgi:hypothetical protein